MKVFLITTFTQHKFLTIGITKIDKFFKAFFAKISFQKYTRILYRTVLARIYTAEEAFKVVANDDDDDDDDDDDWKEIDSANSLDDSIFSECYSSSEINSEPKYDLGERIINIQTHSCHCFGDFWVEVILWKSSHLFL